MVNLSSKCYDFWETESSFVTLEASTQFRSGIISPFNSNVISNRINHLTRSLANQRSVDLSVTISLLFIQENGIETG